MKKRFVTLALALIMACSLAIPAGAADTTTSTDSVKIEASRMTMVNDSQENQEAMLAYSNNAELNSKKISSSVASNREPYLNFSFVLGDTDDSGVNSARATGIFRVAGQEHTFDVSGEVNRVVVDNGDSILVGSLIGDIDQGENLSDVLAMTLCYNEATGEYYIPLCIGTYGIEENPPLLVEFGKSFTGLEEAVNNLSDERESRDTSEDLNIATKTDNSVIPLAVDPTPRLLNSISTTMYSKYVMYTYLYGGKEAAPSGNWRQTVKAQVHLTNFSNGYTNNLGSSIAKAEKFYVSSVLLNYRNSNTTCNIISARPEAQSSSTSLITPTFLIPCKAAAYAASYLSIPISVKGVSHTYSNNYSKIQTKIWSSSNIDEAVTTGSSLSAATNLSNGVSVDMNIHNALTAGNSTTATCNAVAGISFVEVTTSSEIVPRTVTVTSNSISHSLFSKTAS